MATLPQYNPPADMTAEAYYLRRVASLLGVSDPRQLGFHFEDFDYGEANFQRNTSTSGVVRPANNRSFGFYEIDSGATAGSVPTLTRSNAPTSIQINHFPSGTTGVWYMGIRAFPTTAVSTAQTHLGLRMVDRITITTERAMLGKITGQANWGFKADGGGGAFIDSGIAVDTTVRVLEAVRVGGLTYLYVDEVLRGTPSDTFPTTTAVLQLHATNGTDATSRAFMTDWVSSATLGRSNS